jgi:Sulfatase
MRSRNIALSTWWCLPLLAAMNYLPLLAHPGKTEIADTRIRDLWNSALEKPDVLFELGRNALTHLLLLALVWWLSRLGASRLHTKHGLSLPAAMVWSITMLLVALYATNQWLFPASAHAGILSDSSVAWTALMAWLVWLGPIVLVLADHLRANPIKTIKTTVLVSAALGIGLGLAQLWAWGQNSAPARHVVLIGFDSLSRPVLMNHPKQLPHIYSLYNQSVVMADAVAPLGRTFPSWMSMLTGQRPAEHRAFFNLMPLDQVDKRKLVTFELKAQGYQTIFGIDERRFCNIDESFGFDQIAGPDRGLLDFVLQHVNDTPMTNLLMQTELGRWALPFSDTNVAAHGGYNGGRFVERVLGSINNHQPLFLAVHFESGHFPFITHRSAHVDEENFLQKHVMATSVADAQLTQLMQGLKDKGILDNALVVLLSDHGESLGETYQVTTQAKGTRESTMWGHGTSVATHEQNSVVLGYLLYKNGQIVSKPEVRHGLRPLQTVRQAVSTYAQSGQLNPGQAETCIGIETGIRFPAASNYKLLSTQSVAKEAAAYYEVTHDGLLQIKQARLQELLSYKTIGLLCDDQTVTMQEPFEDTPTSFKADWTNRTLTEIPLHKERGQQVQQYRQALLASGKRQLP